MDRREIARRFSEDIVAKYPDSVKSIILYGSVARGEDREESDIDLIVLTKGDPSKMEGDLSDLSVGYSLKYGELPMAFAYREDDFRSKAKKFFFQRDVLKEGVVIYGG